MPNEQANRIARAGCVVRQAVDYFAENLGKVESRWKADKTRVTDADVALSRATTAALAKAFPGDDLVSEEELPEKGSPPRPLDRRFCWVLDPIDGTNNYAAGLPMCGILLALLDGGFPVYGWTYDHLLRRLVEGGPGRGLFVDGVAVPPPPQPDTLDSNAFVTMHFPLGDRYLTRLAPLLRHSTARCLGTSALHYAYNALGVFDGSFGCRGKVWDVAAGHALLAAVGRRMVFLEPKEPFPLREISSDPPSLVNLAGTEAYLRYTLPLFEDNASG
ncbi:MAG: inositol monophosphatase family protein [Puniceicoccales bacterium]|jgi:myo-inositol-1(or 4)-monophosphatase|nr:inositol monophosphatase family protein [Puniceicoccales bacterium]